MVGLTVITGCQTKEKELSSISETGTLILSVNPEIQIEYNKDGKVTEMHGRNEDGKQIVTEYQDFLGKDCSLVVSDLVAEIHDAGYFVEEIEGNAKNIVIQIEPGSVIPDDHFLNEVSSSAKAAAQTKRTESSVILIDDEDYDERYTQKDRRSPYISREKAEEIALAQANVKAADARFDDREFDFENGRNGRKVYELEFTENGIEYEMDIDALTGKVIRAEHHRADWDDNDGNDDWDDDRDDDADDNDDWDDDRNDDADDNDDWDDDQDDDNDEDDDNDDWDDADDNDDWDDDQDDD